MCEQFTYPASLKKDKAGFFTVRFPDFPEALTDGSSKSEALTEAVDCLDEAIAGRIARGEDIPLPSVKKRGQCLVVVPAQIAIKAALYTCVRERGIKNTQLARKMGINEKEVRRMLDPYHASTSTLADHCVFNIFSYTFHFYCIGMHGRSIAHGLEMKF